MERKISIVIPSAGRAKIIQTHRYINNCVACVPQKELGEYKEFNPGLEVVAHPDNVKGLGAKRQYICDKFGDVFMVDDDLKGMMKLTVKAKRVGRVPPELAFQLIQAAGNMAALLGAYLFGFNNHVRPEHYHGHEPFKMSGFINGCGMGILSGSQMLKFNPALKTNHDFYMSALNAFHYRTSWIDKRYCFAQDSFANGIGGSAGLRTTEVEKADFKLLKHYFGPAIVQRRGGKMAAKHEFSKILKIPF